MRVDTSEYTKLARRRPKSLEYGCWVFELVREDGTSVGHFTSKYPKYSDAAAEVRLLGRLRAGRRGKAVLCP